MPASEMNQEIYTGNILVGCADVGEINFYLTQFLSEHGYLRNYLLAMKRVPSPACKYCGFSEALNQRKTACRNRTDIVLEMMEQVVVRFRRKNYCLLILVMGLNYSERRQSTSFSPRLFHYLDEVDDVFVYDRWVVYLKTRQK